MDFVGDLQEISPEKIFAHRLLVLDFLDHLVKISGNSGDSQIFAIFMKDDENHRIPPFCDFRPCTRC